jgi:predicted regulator of Ras-like GTPase activity (Roadblock/LC7/MglB family)
MQILNLAAAAQGVPALQGIFVITMPDCLLFDSYVLPSMQEASDDIAALFGEILRNQREALKLLGGWSSSLQITVESSDRLLHLREIQDNFLIVFSFEAHLPIGMARLFGRRIIEELHNQLQEFYAPSSSPSLSDEQPRAARILEYLKLYAPDPHASMMRLALRTGIPLEHLEVPSSLSAQALAQVEEAVCDILGIDQLSL